MRNGLERGRNQQKDRFSQIFDSAFGWIEKCGNDSRYSKSEREELNRRLLHDVKCKLKEAAKKFWRMSRVQVKGSEGTAITAEMLCTFSRGVAKSHRGCCFPRPWNSAGSESRGRSQFSSDRPSFLYYLSYDNTNCIISTLRILINKFFLLHFSKPLFTPQKKKKYLTFLKRSDFYIFLFSLGGCFFFCCIHFFLKIFQLV